MTGRALELCGRRLWIGIPGPRLDSATRVLLEDLRPGGIVLFGRNIENAGQVRALVADLRDLLGAGLHVAVDQEGGLVVRFVRELVVWPGNMALAAASVRDVSLGEHLGRQQGCLSALELRDLGIDVNLAPVLDLALRGDSPALGLRSFGAHPELSARLGAALVSGTLAGGVLPCVKHFPGLGDAQQDPHLALPIVHTQDIQTHLKPFVAAIAAGAPLVMTSHIIQGVLDAQQPVTFSRRVVWDLLRGELGFSGCCVTDDLEMGAMISGFAWDDVVRRASAAGHDILAICKDADRQRQAHALLLAGLEQGAEWFGDPAAITAHLDALDPGPPGPAPDTSEAARLCAAIAGRAVCVIRDDRQLIPFAEHGRTLLVLCTSHLQTGVEDPLRGEDATELAGLLGGETEVETFRNAPSEADLQALLLRARACDRLLLATTGARFVPWQAQLAARACQEHPACVLVPLRNPHDGEVLPAQEPSTVVCAFGFRPPHLRALADVLMGRVKAYGRLPVSLHDSASE